MSQNSPILKKKKDIQNNDKNSRKIWENFKPSLIHRLKNISELNEEKLNKEICDRTKERVGQNNSFSSNSRCVISLKKLNIVDFEINNNENNNENDSENDNDNNKNDNNDNENKSINSSNDENSNNKIKNSIDHDNDSYHYHIFYDNVCNIDCNDTNQSKKHRLNEKKIERIIK